ncbi:Glutathione-regulated potassium-efflux system protein KefB [Saliniradius amylolyticus]|uniref:Glutathione-regulated potassium-efflux system protein KefB n=1 Tax=Saliniradius amylolyticus TaxID=2183582 RepID=A0A2S2E2D5_9ALTE|nr:monovalent cation:proton antiporter-2 (CPA2) family protein [Saliniradius amylolyticus]AWL11177.1 Glutathione-regulated potassium-efflux system protein KefB [Saliniradius amylolyticus]
MSAIGTGIALLGAAVVAVPIFKKLKLGAILGYLVAGLLIGPAVLNLVSDPKTLLHTAELGVVLLLFIIGLELEPQKLWRMRNQILLSGGGQLVITAFVITAVLYFVLSLSLTVSLVIGLALALSSTAFAIQLMSEHRILKNPPGQQGFSMLLMQDLAVIPILLLVAELAPEQVSVAPAWWVSLLAIIGVLAVGRYLLNPFLRLVSKYGSEEVMTAAALLIVLAIAMSMAEAGLSMGMGAFLAGMLLANSSFKHQLEAEIEPFKGLLLGMFFIAIGMNLDIGLLAAQPLMITGLAVALVAVKGAIIFGLLRANGQSNTDSVRIALMLSQGGEFAFVVMTQAAGTDLIPAVLANQVTLVVGLSMALTSPLVIAHSQWFSTKNCPKVYDTQRDADEPAVIIAGFGRFGQITGRILTANGIPFTALDKSAEHIELVKHFGNKTFYGDATRMDLLKHAGIEHARVLLIAIDDEEDTITVAEQVRHSFPHVRIVARAHNRFTVRRLYNLGVHTSMRELFGSSLDAADQVLQGFGMSEAEAKNLVHTFRVHDQAALESSLEVSEDELIQEAQRNREELASLFNKDKSVS